MTRGAINHIALTVSDLASAEARFYTPILNFLGYQKVEDIPGKMTLWFNGHENQGIFVGLWVPSILSCGSLLLGGRTETE